MPDPDMRQEGLLLLAEILSNQHWDLAMDKYYFLVKQWDVITRACPKSNV